VPGPITLRAAGAGDCPAINDIYNHYVRTDTCTYQLEPDTLAEREAWLAQHGGEHPVLVAVQDGEIVAWGALSTFHPRCGYRHTVEDSVYVRSDCVRRGLGRALLGELLRLAREHGHHSVLALISTDQAGSVVLHEQFGFTRAGRLREVGYKFGTWLDVAYLQLIL